MTRPLLLILPIIFLTGCSAGFGSVSISRDELGWSGPGEGSSILNMGGVKIPVDVSRKIEGDKVVLSLISHDEELEQEQYQVTDQQMDLVRADIDIFTPPIPLLKFPASPGASIEWRGIVKEGEASREATAKVDSAKTVLDFTGIKKTALRVQVHLSINSGSAVPAERTLTFWFTEKEGLLKREFGAGSIREPGDSKE